MSTSSDDHTLFLSEDQIRDLYNRVVAHYAEQNINLHYIPEGVSRLVNRPFLQDGSATIIEYVWTPQRERVAVVHYFLQPDGTIGASGKKDPKLVVWEGKTYRLKAGRRD